MKKMQASSTAKVIAAATLLLHSHGETRHLITRDVASWCELFLSSSWSGRMLAATVKNPITRWMWLCLERHTLPGIIRHYADRKRWIERHCREAFASGHHHLVVIGAGFDTLGVRMALEFPELMVTEIDHPATQHEKHHAMKARGEAWPENFQLIPLNLDDQEIPTSLFIETDQVIVVMEGLLMYLTKERVRHLFRHLRSLPVASSRVIASYMCRRPDGSANFTPCSKWIDFWLRLRHEPFRWSLDQEQMIQLVEQEGFVCQSHATAPEMTSTSAPESALEGENYLLAETRLNPGSQNPP